MKLQSRESQSNAAFHRAAERTGKKVGDHEAVVVDSEGAVTGEAFGVEIVVREGDITAGVDAGAVELTVGECSFTVNVGAAGGDQGVTQNFTKIKELKPSAVTHVPTGVGKVDELRLGIDMRSAGPYIALLQSETIPRNRELRGNTDGNRKKTLRCESYVLPVKIAVVNGMIKRAASVQGEM